MDGVGIGDLVNVINNMPQIANIHIWVMYSKELEDWLDLSVHKILENNPDVTVSHFVKLVKLLGCLRELDIREDIYPGIMAKVQELVEDYLWLKDLKITT